MMRKFFFPNFLALVIWLISSYCQGAEILTKKGPFLHLIKDKLQVRVQPVGKLTKPELEWRKKVRATRTTKSAMKGDVYDYLEADLVKDAEEYRIIDGDNNTPWYPVLNIEKRPKHTFTFIAYGDNRAGGGDAQVHRTLLANMRKEAPSFVISTGDLTQRGDSEKYWTQFFREGKELYSSIPFQPAIGNHDLSRNRYFAHYFDLGDNDQTYYYFKYGKAHFIALDTALNFSPGSEQYNFLKNLLERIQNQSPTIIYFHHAAYSFSRHGSDSKVRQYLVPLFEAYGVDLVINGHDHGYQRIGPINGVQYIVTGGGGAPLYAIKNRPQLKSYKEVYHYVVFEVGDKSIKGTMKLRSDTIEDQFEVVFNAGPTPTKKPPKEDKSKTVDAPETQAVP